MNFSSCVFWRSFGEPSQLIPTDREEIVFCGRSNVGKSTLINKLCNNNKLARVSSTPGKTATINFYAFDDYYLVDLPGYGFSKKSMAEKERWAKLMEAYFSSGRNIKCAVLLLDSRRTPNNDDISMIEYFNYYLIRYFVVLTKTDKLNVREFREQKESIRSFLNKYGDPPLFTYSSLDSESVRELRQNMENEIID